MMRNWFMKALSAWLLLAAGQLHAAAGDAGDTLLFGPVSGAVSETTATVVYRLDASDLACRLLVSTSEDLKGGTSTKVQTTDAARGNTLKFALDGLKAGTTYHYALEVGGKVLDASRGQLRTFPSSFEKISFGFGSCINTDSLGKGKLAPDTKSGLLAAAEQDIAFFLCTGDLFYGDINKQEIDLFRKAYTGTLGFKDAKVLLRKAPLVYMWDDHDYGHNNSSKASPSKVQSKQAYREMIPHYPLAEGNEAPIYQAFSLANVRFILTDQRSQRDHESVVDGPDKTMFGPEQRKWFLEELKRSSETHDMIFWISSVPFTSSTATKGRSGEVVVKGDTWGGFRTERDTIARFIKENNITNLMVITGDAHCIAAADGRHTATYVEGGVPVAEILAGPLLHHHKSSKGGPWSQGISGAGKNDKQQAYGLVTLEQDARSMTVTFSGRNAQQEEQISLKVTYAKGK